MPDLKTFREQVDYYLSQAEMESKERKVTERRGMTRADLADACGYSRTELSRKLNGTAKSPITPNQVKLIVKALAEYHGITTKGQAKELLTLLDVPDFSPADWNAFPLKLLETEGEEQQRITWMSRNPTEATLSPRIERQPIRRRDLFQAIRCRRVVYLVVAAVVVLLMLVFFVFMATSWTKSNKVIILGKVLCIDNERVVGVYISAVNDISGSNFAHWYKTNSNGSEATFRYDLTNGGTYNVHVGCGGSTQDWANTDNTEYGSGAIKDHKFHYFTCQDVPLVAGHGPCYLKQ